jgi:D-alanine-D-alanine ligase
MQSLLPGRKLAFIYNVRHAYPDPNNPLTFNEADFDDENTIEYFIKHLKNVGFDVLPIECDLKAEALLRQEKENIGFALNYSEEVLGSNPKVYMAEVLERLGIPFSGCSNVIQRLIIDKGKMKRFLLKNKVSTLPFQIITSVEQKLDGKLSYPVIVKPIARGSSAGITNKSVVKDIEGLNRQVKFVLETFSEAALIEPYIEGREFSVAMVGNPPQVLPIIEPRHDLLPKDYFHIDSLEVKWELEEELGEGYLTCPAVTTPLLKTEIEKLCLATWEVLGIKDFCRIDIRMNEKDNKLYVLDVNSPPGLIPPEITDTSYLPLAARAAGINYEQLLTKIIEEGLKRY